MNIYDFLLALGFWQWVALLLLVSILSAAANGAIRSIIKAIRNQ